MLSSRGRVSLRATEIYAHLVGASLDLVHLSLRDGMSSEYRWQRDLEAFEGLGRDEVGLEVGDLRRKR